MAEPGPSLPNGARRAYRVRWVSAPFASDATMTILSKADEDWLNEGALKGYRLVRAESAGTMMCYVMEWVA